MVVKEIFLLFWDEGIKNSRTFNEIFLHSFQSVILPISSERLDDTPDTEGEERNFLYSRMESVKRYLVAGPKFLTIPSFLMFLVRSRMHIFMVVFLFI